MGEQTAGIEARNDVTVAIRNWFANRNPLVTRLPYVPVDRVDFLMYTHNYRPRSTSLTVAISSTTQTLLTVSDTSFIMNHDVFNAVDNVTGNSEYIQVAADPLSSTTIVVTRGTAGTSALTSVGNTSTVSLIGNSRTGSEVIQTGLTTFGLVRTQYCQTFQFPVQIGGSAQTARAQVFPSGIQSPFDFNQTVQLQNMVDDMEVTAYYGKAQAPVDQNNPTSTGNTIVTAKSNGLYNIFVTNNTTSPTNASAYGPQDFIRDVLQGPRTNGGEVDLVILSTNWMAALATWGMAVQRIPAGEDTFGTPINVIEAPFLHGATIVEAPLLNPFSAIGLTSSEIYYRIKRNPYWNMRGNRGDMIEGDWIAEGAIEVVNEPHHSWLSGVTAFSAN